MGDGEGLRKLRAGRVERCLFVFGVMYERTAENGRFQQAQVYSPPSERQVAMKCADEHLAGRRTLSKGSFEGFLRHCRHCPIFDDLSV